MNDNARAWVAALRSGAYLQTRRVLRNQAGFCCLGVACDISGIGHWTPTPSGDTKWKYTAANGEQSATDLPPSVADWLGLAAGLVPRFGPIDANDSGMPFAAIADMIEKYADTMFVNATSGD